MKKFLPIFLTLFTLTAFAQWTGPTTANTGVNTNYTFDNGNVYAVPNWAITNGSIVTSSSSGTAYSVTVTWSPTGSGTLTFRNRAVAISSINVTVCASTPAVYNVTSNANSHCSGGPGVTISLSNSQTNVNYQLKKDGVNTGSPLAGSNGNTLAWTGQLASSSQSTFTIVASNASGCTAASATMSGSPVVTVNPLPVAYTVGGGGSICSGGNGLSVTLSSSQSGVNYQLKINGNNSGSAVAGTGSVLTWTGQITAGSYTVVATNATTGCTQTMTGSATITVNALPDLQTVGGGGVYCSGASISVTLSSSQSGVNYQLKVNGNASGSAVAGTGSQLNWTNQSTSGTYTVVATHATTGCTQTMTGSAAVTSPILYTVGGGGTFCSGGSVNVTLDDSQSGVNYQLKANGNNSGSAVAGTGSQLTWLNQTTAGTYTVVAVHTSGCAETMTGSATVTANPDPMPTISVTGPTALLYGTSMLYGTSTTLTATPASYSYQWMSDNVNISGATAASYLASATGSLTVAVKASAASQTCISLATVLTNEITAQTGVNYVSRTAIMKEGVTGATSLYTLEQKDLAQAVLYSDALGRNFQTIGVGQSGTQADVVIMTAYGRDGIIDTTFLPYTTVSKEGKVRINAVRTSSTFVYTGSEQQQFYQNAATVAHDNQPFARTIYKASPDSRVIEQAAPGGDWQPGQHTATSVISLNTITYPVRYFKTDGTTTGNYADKTVTVVVATDENGNHVRSFTNQLGLTVLKQVEESTNTYLQTYYVYDDFGRLTYQVPPKAVAMLSTSANLATDTSLDELIFKYVYDSLGRVIEKKVPGSGWQYVVYDKLGRALLTQDANLRTAGKWTFVKFDYLGRPVYNGLFTSSLTRKQLQNQLIAIDYGTQPYYESEAVNATYYGYTNNAFPTSNTELLTVSYYDHYDFDRNGTPDYNYDNTHLSGIPSSATSQTRGLATGSRKLILGTTDWLKSVVFYDNRFRPLQTQSNNHLNLNVQDKSSVKYFANDLAGHVEKTYQTHTGPSTVNILQRYAYDPNWRTTGIFHTINDGTEQQLAAYTYNALGQVVDKKLHVNGATNLQSIDYRYTIRGWLSSINNAQLTADSGVTNDETNDYFGLELAYNTSAGMSNTLYYNGNISAVKWKSAGMNNSALEGTDGQRAYKFAYDKSDRLTAATFAAKDNNTNWNKQANTLNETMSYDANGNLNSLVRKQNVRGLGIVNSLPVITSNKLAMDSLAYSYSANTNSLTKVEDAATAAGFNNGTVNGTNEYTYNTDGSLTKDDNKGISAITYNILGKPQQVTFAYGSVVYSYDATGAKLKTVTTVDSTSTVTTTDYTGGFVYTNNTLSFFGSPEGRVVKNGSNYEYQYSIADHQGNTRVVFSSVTPTPAAPNATFEGDSNDNSNEYLNVSGIVSSTAANHTVGGSKVIRMNQNHSVGPSKSVKVYAGDKIDAEVWAYYESSTGYGTTNVAASVIASAVITIFTAGLPSGEVTKISAGVNSGFGGFGSGSNQGDEVPTAHLNYILFDKDYKVLDMGWQPVTSASNWNKALVGLSQLSIKEEGYIFVYLTYSNQSSNFVYFDDLKVTHTKSNIVQYNEYYPYGMPTASSWTRENTTGNSFLGNGGTEYNATSSLYDLDYRNYDPVLGRMNGVDPVAGKYSSLTPYNFAFNNPAGHNDPSGADPAQSNYYYEEMSVQNRAYRNLYVSEQPTGVVGFGNGMPGYMFGAGHVTPGSGGYWSDGWHYSDWSPNGGSNMFRAGLAAGYTELGGHLYGVNGQGNLVRAYENNGSLALPSAATYNLGMSMLRASADHATTTWGNSGGGWSKRSVTGYMSTWDFYPRTPSSQLVFASAVDFGVDFQTGGGHWWFDDQGEILFDHWRDGKGKELFLNDPKVWGDYMRAHSGLRDAIEREVAGKFNKQGSLNGAMSYNFGGGYRTGYQLLGGSNATVGGLSYSGYLSINGDELNYHVNLVWNDIQDPIDSWDDQFGAWAFPGTPYTVHVSWSYDFTLYNFDKK
jgi:RHS repeat-associated protein